MSGPKRVVVVGGGMAGVSAALAARRRGADVLLIEKCTCVGGTAAAGLVSPFMGITGGGQAVVRGNLYRILSRIRELFPDSIDAFPDDLSVGAISFDPEAMKHTLDVMLTESGIAVLLDTVVSGVEREGKRIRAITVFNKSGFRQIEGDCFLDASGDADLFFRAGLPCRKGRESDGRVQASTLRFIAGGLDDAPAVGRALDSLDRDPGFLRLLADYGRRAGVEPADMHFQNFPVPGRPDSLLFNVPRVLIGDPVDGDDLSAAYFTGRRLIRAYLALLRERIPGASRAVVTNTAEAMGIRESRRIAGAYVLTAEDVVSGRVFEDSVAAGAWMIDIHNPAGKGVLGHTVAFGEKEPRFASLCPAGGFFGIPYRCLYSKECDNLWAAGRCVSASHEALAAVRIMPTCVALGEAAGIAAALSAARGVPADGLPAGDLADRIMEDGGLIPGRNLRKRIRSISTPKMGSFTASQTLGTRSNAAITPSSSPLLSRKREKKVETST